MQVAEATHKYARGTGLCVVPLYGGASMSQQIRALERGADIVVATPGRALDHIRRKSLNLDADARARARRGRRDAGHGFCRGHRCDPRSDAGDAADGALLGDDAAAAARDRRAAPARSASGSRSRARRPRPASSRASGRWRTSSAARTRPPRCSACSTWRARRRRSCSAARASKWTRWSRRLNAHGYRAEALHGGMQQRQREAVLGRFRAEKADLLIATDVAARGLDIQQLSHVFNYDVPSAPEAYIHRIGRTGRAGREGTAITLAEPREHRLLRSIEQFTRQQIEIATVPTVADLRAKRLELTRASLRERLVAGDFDDVRVVVESLAEEFDVLDIAAAAVKLAHAAADRRRRGAGSALGARARRAAARARPASRARTGGPRRRGRNDGYSTTRLYVGAGREAGVRPADLVGAITNEAGIPSRDFGEIEIADRFSLVEVPEEIADEIIAAMRKAMIRGNKVEVRRDR